MTTITSTSPSLSSEHRDLLRMLGYVYLQNGRPELAAILYQAVHALDPDDTLAAHSLACAHMRSGNPTDALPLLNAIIAKDEASALTHLLRGQALAMTGRIAEAARAMRFFIGFRAAEMLPEKK